MSERHLHAVDGGRPALKPSRPTLDPGLVALAGFRIDRARRVLDRIIELQVDSVAEFGAEDLVCVTKLARSFALHADPELVVDALVLAIRRLAAR